MIHDHDDDDEDDEVSPDLVAYSVIQLPDVAALESVSGPLLDLVESSTIRVLDLVAVALDDLGAVREIEIDACAGLGVLATRAPRHGSLLSDHDIRLAALALAPGTVGIVLIAEDRWAAPLSAAARRAGGGIVAGESIPAHRVTRALAASSDSVED